MLSKINNLEIISVSLSTDKIILIFRDKINDFKLEILENYYSYNSCLFNLMNQEIVNIKKDKNKIYLYLSNNKILTIKSEIKINVFTLISDLWL